MHQKEVGIFTHSGDLHASQFADIAIKKRLPFRIIFTDRMASDGSFSLDPNEKRYSITDIYGEAFILEKLSAIWWRRISGLQQGAFVENKHINYIEASWRNFFEGDLSTIVSDTVFVNDPIKTKFGYNKISQLAVARKVGFNTPKTLISNDYSDIYDFSKNQSVIIKPLITDTRFPIYVNDFDIEQTSENNIRISPSIYQEKLDSTINYRINVFGNKIYSFKIKNERMDWRTGKSQIDYIVLPQEIEKSSLDFIKISGLRMGCIDLKENLHGEIYFLENNPQGQFSFLEAATGFPLMEKFVQYMYSL